MSNKKVLNELFSPDLLGRMHNIDIVLEFKLCKPKGLSTYETSLKSVVCNVKYQLQVTY
jgi:hypothetical protein